MNETSKSGRDENGEDRDERGEAEGEDVFVEGEHDDDVGDSVSGGPTGVAGSVDPEVSQLQNEVSTLNDRLLRLAAEFDNYRKRSQVQARESGVRAQANLVEKLVDVLDDFDRVTSLDYESATVESVLEGVTLVERKLRHLLDEAGLEELDPEGAEFDPNEMEAMVRVPAETSEDDDVVDQVLQRGFRFCGHLVRPARVSVRKYE